MNLKQICDLLVRTGNVLIPCAEVEVTDLEKKFDVIFPAVYRVFLLSMGRGAGEYMLGSSCFYKDLFNIQEGAQELMVENHLPELPEKAFVFWMHQGYMFAYFIADGTPDPKVYFYTEGKNMKHYILDYETLTEFFYGQLEESGIQH